MNEQQLFMALGQVDDRYIEETQSAVKNVKIRKIVIIAACIALLTALCGSAYVISGLELRNLYCVISEDGTKEIGYRIEVTLEETTEEMSMHQIKGQVKEVKEIICARYEDYKPGMGGVCPSLWRGEYETSTQMLDYLGCEYVRFPDLGWKERKSELWVQAKDKIGNFRDITAYVYYTRGDQNVGTSATIYMDIPFNGISVGHSDFRRDRYTQESYVTEDGRTAIIVCAWEENTLCYLSGYAVVGNVLYSVWSTVNADTQQTQAEAIALVKQWLDAL